MISHTFFWKRLQFWYLNLPLSRAAIIVYSSFGALIFSLYIVFDVQVWIWIYLFFIYFEFGKFDRAPAHNSVLPQLMMGGTHRYALDPEEYIFAALNLYLDIINLFIMILNIIIASDDQWKKNTEEKEDVVNFAMPQNISPFPFSFWK